MQPADLYKILGVRRNASAATIHRAYRRKAKEHHPDSGGDPAHFAALKQASDVLEDPQRRARYDRDASIGFDAPENYEWAAAMQLVSGALERAIDATEQSGRLPQTADLQVSLEAALIASRQQLMQKEQAFQQRVQTWQAIAPRWQLKASKGENHLKRVSEWGAEQATEALRRVRREIQTTDEALKIIKDYRFDRDPPGPAMPLTPFGTHTWRKIR